MNAQHTPGPWVRYFENDVLSAAGDLIAVVHAWDLNEQEANAHLIRAAPELLAALEGMLSRYDKFSDENLPVTGIWHDQIINARAAVAKAKGPQL